MNYEHNRFVGLCTDGKAVDQERLKKCVGTAEEDGTCAVKDEPGIYSGRITRPRAFGGLNVRRGEKFKCERSLFASLARQGGVYECLNDKTQALIDSIVEAENGATENEQGSETEAGKEKQQKGNKAAVKQAAGKAPGTADPITE